MKLNPLYFYLLSTLKNISLPYRVLADGSRNSTITTRVLFAV